MSLLFNAIDPPQSDPPDGSGVKPVPVVEPPDATTNIELFGFAPAAIVMSEVELVIVFLMVMGLVDRSI